MFGTDVSYVRSATRLFIYLIAIQILYNQENELAGSTKSENHCHCSIKSLVRFSMAK